VIKKTLESRKDHLQKQIIEALKANDKDLTALLKSQWAHRFGVESLEELKKLDLIQENQNPPQEDNQRIDQSQDDVCEVEKEIPIKEDDIKEKEMTNGNNKVLKSVDVEKKESFKIKSYEIVEKKNNQNKALNAVIDSKKPPKVEALIPLPPKPKYSYLNKWLLRS
tara:strand:- start:105 stop:602 length:498 start_codon:yes stop_codon:yes gene_type:complete